MVRSVPAVLALLLLPAMAPAQQVEVRTHTVERGNTLWSLAEAYYGDPHEWTRIFEANRDRLQEPGLLEPGLVLRIPDEAAGTVRGVTIISGAQPAAGADEEAPGPRRPQAAPRRTTFYPEPPPQRSALPGPEESLAFSEDDFYRAPWLVPPEERPEHAGTVTEIVSPSSSSSARRWAGPFDDVHVSLEGAPPPVGTRLQTFRVRHRIDGLGRVAVPTGTLVVSEAGPDGVVASVDAVFGRVIRGDRVRRLPDFPLTSGRVGRPVTTRLRATIVGFAEAHVLRSAGDYLFLGAGSTEGVQVGDIFEIDREDASAGQELGGGSVRVISVHERYSTARTVSLENPALTTGVVLRLSRRMQ